MKKQFYQARGGETYSTPTIDVLTVQVEQGFAQTGGTNGILDYSPEGDSGFTGGQDNDMGTI